MNKVERWLAGDGWLDTPTEYKEKLEALTKCKGNLKEAKLEAMNMFFIRLQNDQKNRRQVAI